MDDKPNVIVSMVVASVVISMIVMGFMSLAFWIIDKNM